MAGQISHFRLLLHNLSEDLDSGELGAIKFLCADILTKARLEKITNAKELFVAIGEVKEDEEKQLDFLKQLFKNIGRLDLQSKVENFQQTRKGRLHFWKHDFWKHELRLYARDPLYSIRDRAASFLVGLEWGGGLKKNA